MRRAGPGVRLVGGEREHQFVQQQHAALGGDQGVALEFGNWRGVVAPEGISTADRKVLLDTMGRLAKSATWKQTLKKQGWEDAYLAGDAFGEFVKSETARIATVLRSVGLAQ